MTKPLMTEASVEAYLCRKVRQLGGLCLKIKFVGVDGAPDRMVLLPKLNVSVMPVFWVELKSRTGRTRATQLRWHTTLRSFGQRVFIIRSTEEVDEWLNVWK